METKVFSGGEPVILAMEISEWLECPLDFILSSLRDNRPTAVYWFERYQQRQAKVLLSVACNSQEEVIINHQIKVANSVNQVGNLSWINTFK